jgi:GT2 family glycosyltransferase
VQSRHEVRPRMNVSVVIPTYNGRHLLESYLPSVAAAVGHYRATGGEAEIVVVDDGSGDGTAEWLESAYGNCVKRVRHSSNQGLAAACTSGFRAARFPVVLLLNNDVRLRRDSIGPFVDHFSDPRVFAVTGKMFNQREDLFCNGGKVARFRRGMWSTYENYDLAPGVEPGPELLSFTAIGAFSAYDREKYLKLGGFEPLAFLVEDVELSYRAWKRGWIVRYEPRSVAFHDASQTMDSLFRRGTLDRISRRSWILMHWMLLDDPPLFRRHVLTLVARFLVSWLLLDWRFYWGIFSGLAHLGHVRRRRLEARRTRARSDREILELLARFYATAPIQPRNS